MKHTKFLAWLLLPPLAGVILIWTAISKYTSDGVIDWLFVFGSLFLINFYIGSIPSIFSDQASGEKTQ